MTVELVTFESIIVESLTMLWFKLELVTNDRTSVDALMMLWKLNESKMKLSSILLFILVELMMVELRTWLKMITESLSTETLIGIP